MPPLPVVEHLDVFAYGVLCLRTGCERPVVNRLGLETSPEAFHRCVVEAISFAGHRNPETKLLQDCLVLFRTLLTARIGVVYGSGRRAVLLHGSEQSSSRQFRLHPVTDGITNDLAGEDIFDPSHIVRCGSNS